MKKFKNIGLSILIMVLLISVAGCSSQNETNEEIIAEYTDGQVTKSEFDIYLGIANFFEPGLTEYLEQSDDETKEKILEAYLETYIGEKYLAGQIKDDKSLEEKADYTLQLLKEQYIQDLGSEETYQETLTNLNITEDNLYDYLYRYYKAEDYFVKKKYEEDKDKFAVATVSHILISNEERTDEEAKERAEEVLTKLKANGDFSALAKEYSDDPGSKDNGGTYEDVPVALWVSEFMEATISLPINEISDLVKTDYGYHIIKVTERDIPALDKVSDDVRNIIFSDEYSNFMENELSNVIKNINL